MNICLFSSDYLPNIGGIANHVAELGRALVKLGHNVVVFTKCSFKEQKNFKINVEDDKGMKVIRVPIIDIPKIRGLNMRILYYYYLKKILKKYSIDILHWHCLTHDSYVTRKINFDNIVFTNHSSTFLLRMEKKEYDRLKKDIFHAREIIAPSKELCEKTVELGYPVDKVHYISNGVDLDRFTPNINVQELKRELKIKQDEKVVVCARRFAKKNGVIYLVKAIPEIIKRLNGKIKFVFVGDFPIDHPESEKREILDYINEASLNKYIILTGPIPSEDMPRYYSLGDISVLPSLKEATSLSGLESMACGVPVIGTEVGGIPQIIENHVNGVLVPPKNSIKLADAIVSILQDNKERDIYSVNAREFVKENYSWIRVAKDTLDVYKKIL
ncbi:glycosyltransferase family 4 protein [Halothermothrix orenii]|uniref:Glycosyl transferase group 1 n=1 Tax=Halothermothrix orenii (strain H 168 / OCM 544 / DSM 9562) TaxID=373903 RepID=B8D176_HALOH|nr:glycosyltransferase family 4 protein [Halothermothrix orenii]ACL71028.1 glycosyl transferase group 1 [Halothermothrix orenii H 168]